MRWIFKLLSIRLFQIFLSPTETRWHILFFTFNGIISSVSSVNNFVCIARIFVSSNSVAEAEICKMPITNLAKIFGPTIIGYSCPDPLPEMALKQLKKQHLVKLFNCHHLNFAVTWCGCFCRPWRGFCSSLAITGRATWTLIRRLLHLLLWVHVIQEWLRLPSKLHFARCILF